MPLSSSSLDGSCENNQGALPRMTRHRARSRSCVRGRSSNIFALAFLYVEGVQGCMSSSRILNTSSEGVRSQNSRLHSVRNSGGHPFFLEHLPLDDYYLLIIRAASPGEQINMSCCLQARKQIFMGCKLRCRVRGLGVQDRTCCS